MIKDIPKESLVYIGESGIDMTICKDRGWGKKARNLQARRAGNITRELISSLVISIRKA